MMNWYIIQVYSGSEQSVKKEIVKRAEKKLLAQMFGDIVVPEKEVTEIKKGRRVKAKKNFFPGYVFAQIEMNDQVYHLVNDIPKVSCFLSSGGKPKIVPNKEVEDIIKRMDSTPDEGLVSSSFEIGEAVKINDGGSFDSFVGVIEDIDREKGMLTVSVTIFGRSTPVILQYDNVVKVEYDSDSK